MRILYESTHNVVSGRRRLRQADSRQLGKITQLTESHYQTCQGLAFIHFLENEEQLRIRHKQIQSTPIEITKVLMPRNPPLLNHVSCKMHFGYT